MPKKNGKATKGTTAAAEKRFSNGVRIRMFCQGLGDCFLVSLPNGRGKKNDYHILIDFGVAKGTVRDVELMTDVALQIADLTGGKVDLLIITHEHWDHVSGFVLATEEALKKITFDHLWLAWTDDPKDKLARELRNDYGKAKLALARAFAMVGQEAAKPGVAGAKELKYVRKGIQGLGGFLGEGDLDPRVVACELDDSHSLGAAKKGKPKGAKPTIQDAMNAAKASVRSGAITYLRPGDTPALPAAAPGSLAAKLKVRTLGPPHHGPTIRKLDSAKGTYHKEKVAHFGGVPWTWAASLSAFSMDPAAVPSDAIASSQELSRAEKIRIEHEREIGMPFDEKHRIDLKKAAEFQTNGTKATFFFKDHYGFGQLPAGAAPHVAAKHQRRIDGEWMARGAQQLALWINNYTNNVSLVLAFELPKTKKNLLFVGDAQVGNWLSWHDVKMSDDADSPDGSPKAISMTDLFARTVFYKVGHHGSHNATLKEKGLELMTHPDLVAMLPVNHDQATVLGYGEMPLGAILKALNDRCDKRVLQLDRPWKNGGLPGAWPDNLVKARLCASTNDAKKGVQSMEYIVLDQ